ncbi:MAG: septum formation initiator family protein [bacterium]
MPRGWRFWVLWACVVAVFVGFSFAGDNGFEMAKRLRKQREVIQQENTMLRQSNDRLRQEIKLIQQDPALLEWLAKERLGMIGENERVYVFP